MLLLICTISIRILCSTQAIKYKQCCSTEKKVFVIFDKDLFQ